MDDLPTGPALLALARDMLLNDLLPLLPAESRLDARLVASSMAIAEREAVIGEGPAREIIRELERIYVGGAHTLTLPRAQGSESKRAVPLSRTAGEGAGRSKAGEGEPDVLRRFAHDLRVGAFEDSAPRGRDARAILWRLTIAKLRLANPRFLAANGLS